MVKLTNKTAARQEERGETTPLLLATREGSSSPKLPRRLGGRERQAHYGQLTTTQGRLGRPELLTLVSSSVVRCFCSSIVRSKPATLEASVNSGACISDVLRDGAEEGPTEAASSGRAGADPDTNTTQITAAETAKPATSCAILRRRSTATPFLIDGWNGVGEMPPYPSSRVDIFCSCKVPKIDQSQATPDF